MAITRRNLALGFTSVAVFTLAAGEKVWAASAAQLTRDSDAALKNLLEEQPKLVVLAHDAKAILVFPSIVKAGFIVGAQSGNGVLFEHGVPTHYYNISAASYGLQAGVQAFSYALFFMNDTSVAYLASSHGWSVGMGPSVVVLNSGAAKSFTSTTITHDVYAVPFGQKGLMAGIGIEGSKITAIHPDP